MAKEKLMSCRTGCPTQNHRSWGECARAANIQVGDLDATKQKKWDSELSFYKQARAQGIQPEGTQRHQVEKAIEISNAAGKPYNAEVHAPSAMIPNTKTAKIASEAGLL